MNVRSIAPAAAICAALAIWPTTAAGYEVAVLPAEGPAEQTLLARLHAAVVDVLGELGHEVHSDAPVAEALSKLALETVETQKEADRLGASLGVSFVVVPYVSPLAGQNRIEMLVYFLPDGRAEMLEQIAIEGELGLVVEDMLSRLVTEEGLLADVAAGPPPDEPGDAGPGGDGEAEQPPSDEELLEQLDEVAPGPEGQPSEQEERRPGLGDPHRLHAALTGGYTVLLNEPASGGSAFRHGGRIAATIGYVVLPRVGLEVAGDVHALVGRSGVGFGLTAGTGVHLPVAPRFLVGARLGLGFYKGATGAQRASFLLTASPTFEVIVHERVFLRFALPHVTLIAGGDEDNPAVGIMGFHVGLGARF
jgi:hypothetical protein